MHVVKWGLLTSLVRSQECSNCYAVVAAELLEHQMSTSFAVNPTNQDNMFATYKIGNVSNYAGLTGKTMEVIQTSVKIATFAYGYTLTVPLEIIRKV